jgi:hypothetical protein
MNRRIAVAGALLGLAPACSAGSATAEHTHLDASTDPPIVDAAAAPDETSVPMPVPDGAPPGLPGAPCNGEPSFCARTYDSLAYPTTHAAMASADPPFACPTQGRPLRTQLDQGIRALDLEVHGTAMADGGDAGAGPLSLCLGRCSAGQVPVGPSLADVKAFLDVNPREIVTLLLEGGVGADSLAAAIAAAGLDGLALPHAPGGPWPTLQQMIDAGQRVVVFADTTGAAPAWMLPLWTSVAETGRSFPSTAAMSCDVTRGPATGALFLLNEFLVQPDDGGPACSSPSLAHEANAEPFFLGRANGCATARGVKPTFVAVDDYDDGDVFGVVSALALP